MINRILVMESSAAQNDVSSAGSLAVRGTPNLRRIESATRVALDATSHDTVADVGVVGDRQDLAAGLLLVPGHEGPERGFLAGLVRGHHRVLVVAIIGLEELELEVLCRLSRDLLAEDDDAFRALPLLDAKRHREGVDRGVER